MPHRVARLLLPLLLAALLPGGLSLGGCDNGTVMLGEAGRSQEGGAGAAGTSGEAGTNAEGSAGTEGGAGAAGSAGAAGAGGEAGTTSDPPMTTVCGEATCRTDAICCSESCGLCTADGACRDIACENPIRDPECTEVDCGPRPLAPIALCVDGTTTESFCERNDSNECVWVHRECPTLTDERTCGSRGLAACPDGQLCFYEPDADCGRTDLPGVCLVYPTLCPKERKPVCGCDGKTYGNRCLAASQGVGIDYEGECEPPGGDVCGGFAGIGCPDGFYCDYAELDGCGIADGQGLCKEQPTACDKVLAPVCGCDGKSYDNPCLAAAAGISIASEGKCGTKPCGDTTCNELQFCLRDLGSCDGPGVCETRPDLCTLEEAPVCGCNGETYSNSCAAQSAGVNIAAEGACK